MRQPLELDYCIFPEQRCLEFRQPEELCPATAVQLGRPKTVANLKDSFESYYLSLDEAIQVALANAEVIRVLTGNTAVSTGRTVYDAAITNTDVDAQRAVFDPVLETANTYQSNEFPERLGGAIVSRDSELYDLNVDVSQMKANGGQARLNFNTTPTRNDFNGLAFDPRTPSSLALSYTQPLLRGRGVDVNLAPIVIARINTERTFYQLKDSVQELVRSVVEGYWSLVQARVDLWARQQQVDQLEYAYDRLDAQRRVELADLGDTAQAKVSLEQFRANLISAQAQVLDLEAALFNVMGLPPVPNMRLVPVTPPLRKPIETEWDALITTAMEQRPDVIERKLAIETIQQQLLINCNNTLPQLDAVGLARMNGLRVETAAGDISSDPFQATDIQVGLNLRTPIGQRGARAALRQQELNLARERANLQQQLHAATHTLAQNIRNLEQFYRQYEAFKRVRDASKVNLERRFEVVRVGGLPNEPLVYLDVLLAVTDWGNSVSSEALALTQYNSEIANLERQVGVILRRHGIVFQEEGFQSLGPLGRWGECQCYPESTPVGPNGARYESGDEPAEDSFDLTNPAPIGVLRDPNESSIKHNEKPNELRRHGTRSTDSEMERRGQLNDNEPNDQSLQQDNRQLDRQDYDYTARLERVQPPAVFQQMNYTNRTAVPAGSVIAERLNAGRTSESASPAADRTSRQYQSAVQTLQLLNRLPPTKRSESPSNRK